MGEFCNGTPPPISIPRLCAHSFNSSHIRRKFDHAKLTRSTFAFALSLSISGEVMHHIIDLLIFIFCSRCLLPVSFRAKQRFNKTENGTNIHWKQNCENSRTDSFEPPVVWLCVHSFVRWGNRNCTEKAISSKSVCLAIYESLSIVCLLAVFSLLRIGLPKSYCIPFYAAITLIAINCWVEMH